MRELTGRERPGLDQLTERGAEPVAEQVNCSDSTHSSVVTSAIGGPVILDGTIQQRNICEHVGMYQVENLSFS